MGTRSILPLSMLLKATALLSLPGFGALCVLVVRGTLPLASALFGYVLCLIGLLILLYPLLSNIHAFTRYVKDLARDKKVSAPDLSSLNAVADLSDALTDLQHSWELRQTLMEKEKNEREILVDSLPDILIMTNENMEILRTNRAARDLFGQNLQGQLLESIVPNDKLLNGAAAVMDDLKGRMLEFQMMEPEPKDFRALIERFPVASTGGIALVLTLNDVTELKRVEKMRADFVANASHEIRTPLASISGFIETLQGPAKDDENAREQFLTVMNEQAKRLTALVTDLLSLSKIEMNSQSLPTGRVDVLRMIKSEKESFGWMANQKKMEIIIDQPDTLPEVRGDENELRQVLHNLIGNAIKYGHEGTNVIVTARITSALPNDPNFIKLQRAVMVSVRDHGEGIAREHLPRLTERFYRVDSARTRKIGGTGLGLAIVKHILNRHRSALTIDSIVGDGSTFSVYLPVYDDVADYTMV